MEIRDLIINTEPATLPDGKVTKKVSAPKKKPTYTFEVAVCSGCDFAVRRKTAKTEKLLVIMPSQELYYIKNDDGSVEQLNGWNAAQQIKKFLISESNSVDVNCNWMRFLDYSSAPRLEEVIGNGTLSEMARKGCLVLLQPRYGWSRMGALAALYEQNPTEIIKLVAILKSIFPIEDCGGYSFMDIASLFEKVSKKFGIENACDFIRRLCENDNDCCLPAVYIYDWDQVLSAEVFKYKTFADYIFDELPWQGYENTTDALRAWKDYLMMSKAVGNSYDKYPSNLFQAHTRINRIYASKKLAIDAANWAKASEKMLPYEYEGSEFRIISPKKPDDMVTEAAQQHNCLRSYIQQVTDGKCKIFFMRRNDSPDKSLVTIEVHTDDSIGQVYAASNRRPTDECLAFVSEWAKAKGLKYEAD